jgi:segregation and condensation protein B
MMTPRDVTQAEPETVTDVGPPDETEDSVDAAETEHGGAEPPAPAPDPDEEPAETGPVDPSVDLDDAQLQGRLEALLLSCDKAVSSAKLAEWMDLGIEDGGSAVIKALIDRLNDVYEQTGRAFSIERVARGWQIRTRGEYADVIAKMRRTRSEGKLSQAALETLAIIAYRQPVLRADIEAIRGVACGEVLRSLMERHMVKIVGRAEVLGRPMLYGTTTRFLETFGLASIKDLPQVADLKPSSD